MSHTYGTRMSHVTRVNASYRRDLRCIPTDPATEGARRWNGLWKARRCRAPLGLPLHRREIPPKTGIIAPVLGGSHVQNMTVK